MRLSEMIGRIGGPDPNAAHIAQNCWDGLAKPLGSLGVLEEDIVRIAALTGDADVKLNTRTLFVFCADNGVVAQGVTQCGSNVTAAVAAALANGTSTVCRMAVPVHCRVIPVDVGISAPGEFPGVLNRKVCSGTADITQGPAMTGEQTLQAVQAGYSFAEEYSAAGTSIFLTGEMGIGNTTTSAAVLCALLGLSPAQAVGRGAGLSDEGLSRKKIAVETALTVNRPDPNDPMDVLQKVGGADLAALCGLYLGAAACRKPILIDGLISAVAALCTVRLCPCAANAMIASHLSSEPAARAVLGELGTKPLICAGMHLGEGTGAVAALSLLDLALAVYHGGTTFGKIGIDAYTPQQ